MAPAITNQFEPDYAISPGEILEETLEARGMKKVTFAKRVGLSEKTISQIIKGKAPVTPESAIQFERVLDVSASIWNNLESYYRLYTAKKTAAEKLQHHVKWAKKFPIKELVNKGIIEKPTDDVDSVEKLLNFLGVGSIKAWQERLNELSVAYRHSPSFQSAPEAITTWLRIGELYAENIPTEPYSESEFVKALYEIRNLTTEPPDIFGLKVVDICKNAGVALVFVSELRGTHLSGASRWLTPHKALLMLSLRYKTDDHLWFSFFHEAAHILQHAKKKKFIDEIDNVNTEEEKEADNFASEMLISSQEYATLISQNSIYKDDIISFAKKIGIASGIVVGRLQHDKKIPFNRHNKLKRKLKLVESI